MTTILIGEEEMMIACEMVSRRQEQVMNNQDSIIRSTLKANQVCIVLLIRCKNVILFKLTLLSNNSKHL